MKRQTGIRVDAALWEGYKNLCKERRLRPNEPVEAFLKACNEKGDIMAVLNSLEGQSPGETLAYELRLRSLLSELEAYYDVDKRAGGNMNAVSVNVETEQILQLLPKISNPELLNQTKSLVEEIVAYYKEAYVKDSTETAYKNKDE